MNEKTIYIILADDDADDRMLFVDALDEIPLTTEVITAYNGEQLMDLLHSESAMNPDVLFLDLNMPRKNGYDCLADIKGDARLRHIPVVIYSTSCEQESMDKLYDDGANYYIRKPGKFSELKTIIHKALLLISGPQTTQPSRSLFLLKLNAL